MAVAKDVASALCGRLVLPLSMAFDLCQTPMRLLVIGCGSMGKRHIGNLLALNAGRIVTFDSSPDRRRETQSRFPVDIVDRLEDAWELSPGAALITAPTSMHVPLALQAAKRGCHLFIEKPLSHRLEEIDELLRAVRAQGLVTLVGCNLRFHPGLLKIKQLLNRGTIGRVVAARVEVGQYLPDWHPGEDYRQGYSAQKGLGGGVILDAIHEIDYVRWMLGDVEAVSCFTAKLGDLEIDTEDTAAILLRISGGAIAEMHLDYIQRTYSRSCHIIGTEGTIRWDYTTGQVRWYTAAAQCWEVFVNPPGWEPNQMYLDELQHFLGCLGGEEEPALDVFEAARVLEIALAAKAANETAQVVKLQH